MQTSKLRSGSLEVPQRTSSATSRTARQLKMSGSESDPASSHTTSRTPKERSPKVIERKSPRSPMPEKKRPSKVLELESQLAQLQEDLKRANDELSSSELWKKNLQQETEEAKRQFIAMKAKFEESQRQLLELSASDDARLLELRKLSQERDRAWRAELEAVREQHSIDSAALLTAMNEMQRLKIQLDKVTESEATQSKRTEAAKAEIRNLKLDLDETLSLLNDMKVELRSCKESEAQAQALVNETLLKLETAKTSEENVGGDGGKAMEDYKLLLSDLDQSRAQVRSLEDLVSNLKADLVIAGNKSFGDQLVEGMHAHRIGENENIEEVDKLRAELSSTKSEVQNLRSALEIAEVKYQEEQIRSTMQVRSAYELLEQRKSESTLKEAELEADLKRTKSDLVELNKILADKQTELQIISKENDDMELKIAAQSEQRMCELEMELQKLRSDVEDMKANLMDKETELQNVFEENEDLKSELKKKETDEANSEQEVLMRLECATEEADKSTKRAAWVTEQLEAAQATCAKLETELRRLKVQSDQWRKAAEAAAAILTTEESGKLTGQLDNFYDPVTGRICSPNSDDQDDDSPKKRNNNNMLKKIGVLWKKSQK
ncbi:hypothetical protein Sjap_001614 [Stephania japonica]|uniref:Interactor of constitutive active ROPs 2, chloroplastic n=1 Tax=Stephania japonica TaxID=461633 RepID=A0AAP0PTP2_9MAGN